MGKCHFSVSFNSGLTKMIKFMNQTLINQISIISVNVKWGKEKFENVDVDTSEPPEVFKAQLFALSGVPPDRQKVMGKGMTLKVFRHIKTFFILFFPKIQSIVLVFKDNVYVTDSFKGIIICHFQDAS